MPTPATHRCQSPYQADCPRDDVYAMTIVWAHAPGQPYLRMVCGRHAAQHLTVTKPGDVVTMERVA